MVNLMRTLDEICETGAKKEHFLGRIEGVFSPIELVKMFPKQAMQRLRENFEVWKSIAQGKCPNCGSQLYFRHGGTFGVGFTYFRRKVAICVECDEAWIWEEEG